MSYYLWEMRPYFRQVAGQLVLGSIAGIIMNTAVVLPAILLGQAIDAALAFERGEVGAGAVGWAALAFVGGTLLTEVPRIAKRWWLMTANARIRANIRADAWRGVIAWPMARLDRTPAGDVMARIIGDVEVLGVGVREFTIETWDTILFSLSLMVAMLVYDLPLTVLALLPVPVAMLLAKATGRWVAGRTTASRQANASLTTALQEQLAGIRVLRLFGRTGAAVERVDTLCGGASRHQPGPGAAARRTPAGLHHAHECWRPARGLAGGREGRQRRHDGGGLHRLPGALSPLRQPWLSGAPDDQLHPGRRRRLRAAPSTPGSPPTALQRATWGLLPCRPHRRNAGAGA